MKCRRLAFVVLAILLITALSAASAAAQTVPQQAQSGDLSMPTEAAGTGPTNITSNFDTGNEQVSTSQMAGPQPKERRDRRDRNAKDDPAPTAPTQASPSSGNPTYPAGSGGSGGTPAPAPAPSTVRAELPRTGGGSVDSLFTLGAGALLVGGGLLARRIIK